MSGELLKGQWQAPDRCRRAFAALSLNGALALVGLIGPACGGGGGEGDPARSVVEAPSPATSAPISATKVPEDAPGRGDGQLQRADRASGPSEGDEGSDDQADLSNSDRARGEDPGDAHDARERRPIQLRFVGDIIFGRYRAQGFDPIVEPLSAEALAGPDAVIEGAPFAKMASALKGDLLVANLETPLSETVPEVSPSHADYRFAGSREMARMLPEAGFDVVSLANNHHNDLRELGHANSEKILAQLAVVAIGGVRAQAPAIRVHTIERAGWRIAMVAVTSKLNMGLSPAPPYVPFVETKALVRELGGASGPIAQARSDHDLVIVSLHWGEEYTDHPSPLQKKSARALIDAGADVVFGHHPHVLQGIEQYGGGVIAYSMGNFLFENASAKPKLTGVLGLTFSPSASVDARACLVEGRFEPAVIQRKPYHHPAPAHGRDYRALRDRLLSLSRALSTRWGVEAGGEASGPGSAEGAFKLQQLPACANEATSG